MPAATASPTTRLLAGLGALVAALAFVLGTAIGQAGATSPVSQSPAAGATVPASPGRVEVVFDEPVIPAFGGLKVTDASGKEVQGEPIYANELTHVAVKLPATLPPGVYTASYAVQAPNGPILRDTWTFTIADPAAATASTSGTNWWRIAAWAMLGITGLLLLGQVFLFTLAAPEDRAQLQPKVALASGVTLVATIVLLVLAATVGT